MIAVILLACVVGKGFYEKCKIQDIYEHALDLMEEGEYQEADIEAGRRHQHRSFLWWFL